METIKMIFELLKDEGSVVSPLQKQSSISNSIVDKVCVVRTYSAGVYIGTVKEINGQEGIIADARIIHSWNGAKTTLDIANNFITEGNLSGVVDKIYLSNIITITPLTQKAQDLVNKLSKGETKF